MNINVKVLCIVFFAFLLNETNIKASTITLAIVASEISLFQELGKEDKNIGIELARKAKSSGDLKLAAYTYLNLINKFPDQTSILTEYASFISNQEKITVQELDELSNLLMISVFKVPVGEVKKVLDLAQQIGAQKEKLSAKLDVPKDDETKDVKIESEKLLKQVEIFPGDETKFTLLYAQMHAVALNYPKDTITFDFTDGEQVEGYPTLSLIVYPGPGTP